jgi:hypothetical protein
LSAKAPDIRRPQATRTFDSGWGGIAHPSIELEVIAMSTSIWSGNTPEAEVQTREGSLRTPRIALVILQLFVGVGGIAGGLEMIRHPLNPFGVTPELIAGTPFDTFTWPGVLLLVLVGVAPSVMAIGLIAGIPRTLPLSGLFGIGLMAWIGVQWALLQDRLWLQPVMFCLGTLIAALALHALRRGER